MKNTGTLTVSMPSLNEIVLTRVFNAPRRLVFDAFTKPELLERWFGPRGWCLVVCEVDYRVGGGFRFVLRSPEGLQMGLTAAGRVPVVISDPWVPPRGPDWDALPIRWPEGRTDGLVEALEARSVEWAV